MTEKNWLTAVVADVNGAIFDLPGYAAAGMAGGGYLAPLTVAESIVAPYGSELMYLPDRAPVLFNIAAGEFETLHENPLAPGEPVFPVAAFNSPGYVITHVSAFREHSRARLLPLFSYGAAGWHRGQFRSAAIRVDAEPRQDLRRMKPADVSAGVRAVRRRMPANRLRQHLETCALRSGCPAGKNFFLGRYEAPLPTAKTCNARCLGCLSLQKESGISCTQERIAFTPTSAEIAEVALFHIGRVKKAVVSFGQGCEGEPLSAARAIEPAIRLIRSETGRGTINLNTNASLPEAVGRLCDAGLDSIRVSMNSVRRECYEAYFRPKGYAFGRCAAQHRHRPRKGQIRLDQLPQLPRFYGHARGGRGLLRLHGGPSHPYDPVAQPQLRPAALLEVHGRRRAPRGADGNGGADPGNPARVPEAQVRLL